MVVVLAAVEFVAIVKAMNVRLIEIERKARHLIFAIAKRENKLVRETRCVTVTIVRLLINISQQWKMTKEMR